MSSNFKCCDGRGCRICNPGAEPADNPQTEPHVPSKITQQLITQIVDRDIHGAKKYGTTLDRKDLTLSQWLQHMAEELMDGAGYALAAKREHDELVFLGVKSKIAVVLGAYVDSLNGTIGNGDAARGAREFAECLLAELPATIAAPAALAPAVPAAPSSPMGFLANVRKSAAEVLREIHWPDSGYSSAEKALIELGVHRLLARLHR